MTAMVPTIMGLNEATKGTRDQENSRKNTARKQRCHLVAMCEVNKGTQTQREQVHNARVYVGRDGNVSILKQLKAENEKKKEFKKNSNHLSFFISALYHQTTQLCHVSFQWWLLHTPGFPPGQYLWHRDHHWRTTTHFALGVPGFQHTSNAMGWASRQ